MRKKRLAELMQRYPAISDLQQKALKRIPHLAREYLESGTGDEAAVARNLERMAAVTLVPRLLKGELKPEIATSLFGQTYQAPFGIAPVGLSGLMWARSECILAATAARYAIPYCLSTVATQTPETIQSNLSPTFLYNVSLAAIHPLSHLYLYTLYYKVTNWSASPKNLCLGAARMHVS